MATYKVGDSVLFTFLGETMKGEIIAKDGTRFKILEYGTGMKYPSIRKEEPKKLSKTEQMIGFIIKKIGNDKSGKDND